MMAIAVAAMSFTACSNDLTEDVTPSQEFTVQINAVENLSRTHFGDLNEGKYPTLWDATDKVKASLNMTTAKNSTETTIADGGTTASFKLSLNESTAPYTIYAISPANVASSISSQYGNWTITIPDSQEPSATSCDPAAQVVVSQTEALETLPSSVDMKFEHLTAYAKINFTNVTLGDAVVNSVTITADQNIAGKFYYQVADKDSYTAGQLREVAGAKTITVTTSDLNNVWVALVPTAVSKLTFTINTDQGTITKEVTGLEKEFKSGVVATFNVDMTGKTIEKADEYTLVTDLSVLAEGDNVIIVAAKSNYAISVDNSGSYRPATPITKDGETIIPTTTVGIFTIHDAGTNLYAFKEVADGKYLYDSSTGSDNYLQSQPTNNEKGYWDITITDSNTGAAKVVSQSTGKIMMYNYNSGRNPRFACYGGTGDQDLITLYYKSNGGAKIAIDPQIVVSDIENVSADGMTDATVNIVVRNLSGAITATPDGTVVTAASVNENVVTYSVAANNGAARDGSITLKCGAYEKVVKVSQLEKVVGYAAEHNSNVTLTTTGGTSATSAKVVISGTEYNAIKAGTGSKSGAWKVTVPAGTTKLHVHLAGWKGANVTVKIEGATATPATLSLKSDDGITSSSPFTLQGNPTDFYHEIALSGITSETTLTVTATAGYRFVAWGVNAE